jgi:hypothetical protein
MELRISLGIAHDFSKGPAHLSCVLGAPLGIDPETSLDAVAFRIFHYDSTFSPPGKTAVTCFLPTYNYNYWVDLQRSDHARYEAEKSRIAEAMMRTVWWAAILSRFAMSLPHGGIRRGFETDSYGSSRARARGLRRDDGDRHGQHAFGCRARDFHVAVTGKQNRGNDGHPR